MLGKKTKVVEEFWQQCRRKQGIATDEYHACSLSDPKYLDSTVASLDLSGQPDLIGRCVKRGTAHLLLDFELNGVPRRAVGDYWVILDDGNRPLFLVRVTHVSVAPFMKVPESFAAVEGEGDSTLAWWQDAHREYY